MTKENKKLFSGETAFLLYDTYGFPLDLTESILREKNIELDIEGFNKAMQAQKERAKAHWVGSGDLKNNDLYLKIKQNIEFLGYDYASCNAKILYIIKDNQLISEANAGDDVDFITDKTVFYGECGGQVGDTGLAMTTLEDGSIPMPFNILEVYNTLKPFENFIIHKAKVENGKIKVGDFVNLTINRERRKQITANHSAVHLLNFALRELFGNSVVQKGSYVDEKKGRFDINYNQQFTAEDLIKLEEIVNKLIIDNTEVKKEVLSLAEAKANGAVSLIGENYGDEVRVISLGKASNLVKNKAAIEKKEEYKQEDIADVLANMDKKNKVEYCSIELCGGTHIKRTGDIGLFKIIREESIASGIRRLEIATGLEALKYINANIKSLNDVAKLLNSSKDEIIIKIQSMQEENKKIKKQLQVLESSKLGEKAFGETKINNITIAMNNFENVDGGDLKQLANNLLNEKYRENSIVIINNKTDAKNILLVAIAKNLNDRYSANNMLNQLGAKGGGQAWISMVSIEKFKSNEEILEELKNILNS